MLNKQIIAVGDTHNGAAAKLVVDDDKKYIIKPRIANNERAWQAFLHNLEAEGLHFVPGCVRVLREGEGFHEVEFVNHTPAESVEQVHDYFKRCGTLLFLTYLLNSNDFHSENLVACADSPFAVDLETLLTGEIAQRGKKIPLRSLADTVMNSGLLPSALFDGKELVDMGGITGKLGDQSNLLLFNGIVQNAFEFESDILYGFEQAYLFAMQNKKLVADNLKLFSTCTFRQLLRPTEVYGKVIDVASCKFEGEAVRIFAHAALSRAYKHDIDPDRLETINKVLECEVDAVANGEIPLFYTYGNSLDLFCRNKNVLNGFLSVSPVDATKKRLDSLCDDDLLSQRRIISLALAASRPLSAKPLPNCSVGATATVLNTVETAFVPVLANGFAMLEQRNNGNVSFISSGTGLYDGLSGIMCFLAAMQESAKAKDLLERCFEKLSTIMSSVSRITLSNESCNLSNGIAGQIAALCHITQITGNKHFANFAEDLFEKIVLPSDGITDTGDVLNGAAGLALQLPKLPGQNARRIADALACTLAQSEVTLTGVAHGAAGIALSLGAVQKVLDTDKYTHRIVELLKNENLRFDTAKGNWQDMRRPEKKGFANGWCSGAPGIAMARKRLAEYCTDNEVRAICYADIERACASIAKDDTPTTDSLCCGSASRLAAAGFLNINVDSLSGQLEQRIKCGEQRLYHLLETCDINAGLMQGISGVGYALAMYGRQDCGGMLI